MLGFLALGLIASAGMVVAFYGLIGIGKLLSLLGL
jgi:hypothetical protein